MAALMVLGVAAAGWRAAAGRDSLGFNLPTPRPGSIVTGGPFQRVVYNVRTHIALATPGRFRDGELSFEAPAVQYNDVTHVAWTTGPCRVTEGSAYATAASGSADFARRSVTLSGSVRFHLPATADGGRRVVLDLTCPTLTYSSSSGDVQCLGGVTGKLSGVEDLPGTALPSLEPGAAAARMVPARGPVSVNAASLSYSPAARVLAAAGGVRLTQQAALLQCQSLSFDVGRRVLRLAGAVSYSDSSGRTLEGLQAVENLNSRSVLIQGPLRYSDRKGNRVEAAAATLDQRLNVATLSGNVRFSDAQGLSAETPFVTIAFDSQGAQTIRTGPLRIRGTASTSGL